MARYLHQLIFTASVFSAASSYGAPAALTAHSPAAAAHECPTDCYMTLDDSENTCLLKVQVCETHKPLVEHLKTYVSNQLAMLRDRGVTDLPPWFIGRGDRILLIPKNTGGDAELEQRTKLLKKYAKAIRKLSLPLYYKKPTEDTQPINDIVLYTHSKFFNSAVEIAAAGHVSKLSLAEGFWGMNSVTWLATSAFCFPIKGIAQQLACVKNLGSNARFDAAAIVTKAQKPWARWIAMTRVRQGDKGWQNFMSIEETSEEAQQRSIEKCGAHQWVAQQAKRTDRYKDCQFKWVRETSELAGTDMLSDVTEHNTAIRNDQGPNADQ